MISNSPHNRQSGQYYATKRKSTLYKSHSYHSLGRPTSGGLTSDTMDTTDLETAIAKLQHEMVLKNKLIYELKMKDNWLMTELALAQSAGFNPATPPATPSALAELAQPQHIHSEEAKMQVFLSLVQFNKNLQEFREQSQQNASVLKETQEKLRQCQEGFNYYKSIIDLVGNTGLADLPLDTVQHVIAAQQQRIQELELEQSSMNKQLSESNAQMDLWTRSNKRNQDARIQAEACQRTLEHELATLKKQLEQSMNESNSYQERIKQLETQIDSKQKESISSKEQVEHLDGELHESLEHASRLIQDLERENADLNIKIEQLSRKEEGANAIHQRRMDSEYMRELEHRLKDVESQLEKTVAEKKAGESALESAEGTLANVHKEQHLLENLFKSTLEKHGLNFESSRPHKDYLSQLEMRIVELTNSMEKMDGELHLSREAVNAISGHENRVKELELAYQVCQEQVVCLQQIESHCKKLETENYQLKDNFVKINMTVEALNEEIAKTRTIEKEYSELQSRLDMSQEELEHLKKVNEEAVQKELESKTALKKCRSELETLQQKLQEKDGQLALLQTQLQTIELASTQDVHNKETLIEDFKAKLQQSNELVHQLQDAIAQHEQEQKVYSSRLKKVEEELMQTKTKYESMEKLVSDETDALENYEASRNELAKTKQELSDKNLLVAKLTRDLQAKLAIEPKLEQLESQRELYTNKNAVLEAEMKSLLQRNIHLENELKEASHQLAKTQDSLKEIEILRQNVEKLTIASDESETRLSRERESVNRLQVALHEKECELQQLQESKQNPSVEPLVETSESELPLVKGQLDLLQKELQNNQHDYQSRIKEKEAQILVLEEQLDELKQQLINTNSKRDSRQLEEQIQTLTNSIGNKQLELQECDAQIVKLKQQAQDLITENESLMLYNEEMQRKILLLSEMQQH